MIGEHIAAISNGVNPRDLDFYKSAGKVVENNYQPIAYSLVKSAHTFLKNAGVVESKTTKTLELLKSATVWTEGHTSLADEILPAFQRAMDKNAFAGKMMSMIPTATGGASSLAWLLGVLGIAGGGLAGGTKWMIDRSLEENDQELGNIDSRIDNYKSLAKDLERELGQKYDSDGDYNLYA